MSDQALSNAVAQYREGEAEVGKPAGHGRIWSVLATVCDASEEAYLQKIVARLATFPATETPWSGSMAGIRKSWRAFAAMRPSRPCEAPSTALLPWRRSPRSPS